MNTLHKLDGYKTYILAALIMVASAAHAFAWIDTQAYLIVMSFLAPGALASIRQGIKNNKL